MENGDVHLIGTGQKYNDLEDLHKHVRDSLNGPHICLWRRVSREVAAFNHDHCKQNSNVKDVLYFCVQRECEARKSEDCPFSIRVEASPLDKKLVACDVVLSHNHNMVVNGCNMLTKHKNMVLRNNSAPVNGFATAEQSGGVVGGNSCPISGDGLSGLTDRLFSEIEESMPATWTKCHLKYMSDENDKVQGIFVQSISMKYTFARYPEIILIDVVPGIVILGMHPCLITAIDGCGVENVIAFLFVANLEKLSLKSMFRAFKDENPRWKEARLCLMRRTCLPREVLKSQLPQIAFFFGPGEMTHIFGKEICKEMLGSNKGKDLLAILRDMAFAQDQSRYQTLYNEFRDLGLPEAKECFDRNWHDITDEWVRGFQIPTLLPKKYGRTIEMLGAKLASVTTFADFFATFAQSLNVHPDEKEYVIPWQKTVPVDKAIPMYFDQMTSFAFKMYDALPEQRSKLAISCGKIVVTSAMDCSCRVWKLLRIPCHHIMFRRRAADLPQLDEILEVPRWSVWYHKETVERRATLKYESVTNEENDENMKEAVEKVIDGHMTMEKAAAHYQVDRSVLYHCAYKRKNTNLVGRSEDTFALLSEMLISNSDSKVSEPMQKDSLSNNLDTMINCGTETQVKPNTQYLSSAPNISTLQKKIDTAVTNALPTVHFLPSVPNISTLQKKIDSIVTNSIPTVNGASPKEDCLPVSTTPGEKKPVVNSQPAHRPGNIELYNFGNAPLEVIERFQEFCYDYPSLTDSLHALLKRDALLKNKYKFKLASVTYQMLAEPTIDDSPVLLTKAITELQRFTRLGKYESVANAIEELLFSPNSVRSHCQSTWTCGNVGTSYTELDLEEQMLLEKIADALLNRLAAATPPTRKRRYARKDPEAKRKKTSQDKQTSSSKTPSPDSSFESVKKHSDVSKYQGNYMSLKATSSLGTTPEMDEPKSLVDVEVAIPLKNFLEENKPNFKPAKPDVSAFTSNIKYPSKSQFYKLFLDLLPHQTARKQNIVV